VGEGGGRAAPIGQECVLHVAADEAVVDFSVGGGDEGLRVCVVPAKNRVSADELAAASQRRA
jgi:prolyl-tRNA editing enzyme YbaK/EbsC (Cys-tRNA(Pro) deacylase)